MHLTNQQVEEILSSELGSIEFTDELIDAIEDQKAMQALYELGLLDE